MARPKGSFKTPSYRRHAASGQAVVTIDGRDHYLGKYDSKESRDRFDKLVGEWLATGRQSARFTVAGTADLRIAELIAGHWNHLKETTPHSPSQGPRKEPTALSNYRSAFQILRRLYGDTPVREFGPLALKVLQREMANTPIACKGREGQTWCRNHVNRSIRRIVGMFKWGVSMELVPASVYQALRTVDGLRPGAAPRETERVGPAEVVDVDAVLSLATPTIAAMIRLQLLTGMRSGEVCIMRACDIERRQDVWIYRPSAHKTEHLGKSRIIPLGPQAQEVVAPFLTTNLAAYLFQPRRANEERWAAMRAAAKGRYRPQPGRKQKNWRERYTSKSYGLAIKKLCKRADRFAREAGQPGIERWHPHQLRHTAATLIRARYGIEAASVLLGHSDTKVTEIYAEKDLAQAMRIMSEVG